MDEAIKFSEEFFLSNSLKLIQPMKLKIWYQNGISYIKSKKSICQCIFTLKSGQTSWFIHTLRACKDLNSLKYTSTNIMHNIIN